MGAYIIRLGVKAVSHFWGIRSEAISIFHVGGNLDGLLLLVDRAHDSEGFGVSSWPGGDEGYCGERLIRNSCSVIAV